MLTTAIQRVYDGVLRERLPTHPMPLRGVAVPDQAALLDATDYREDHEPALIDAVHDLVAPGDDVLVLGGGYGVSAVHAAIWVGQNGSVTAFEAASEMLAVAETTIAHAPTPCPIDLRHGVIGDVTADSVARYGAPDGEAIEVGELPECDVLVCDIEGAERGVLADLALPDRVVVEAHPHLGASVEFVTEELAGRGFETEDVSQGYDPDVVVGRR